MTRADRGAAWPELAWDGLRLLTPPDLEPVRLGRGYMLLEDESGPRLELRWQPAGKRFSLERALARARLVRLEEPGPLVSEVFSLLPTSGRAVACAPEKDPQRRSLLLLLPSGRLAVVAGFFPNHRGGSGPAADGMGNADLALARAVSTLDDSLPGLVRLYDIALRAPEGMELTEFSFELGRFRLLYQDKAHGVEYARFAPARAILAGTELADWTARALASWAGRGQSWRETLYAGREAAELHPGPELVGRSFFARLRAGLCRKTRPARGLAWLGDASRILAVRAVGDLSPEAFGAMCRDYVVSSPSV